MERRTFLRTACGATLATFYAISLPGILSSCAGSTAMTATVEDKKFSLPLSAFVGSAPVLVQPEGMAFPVSVQRVDEHNYRALVLRCTHASNQLTETGNGYVCDAHGSRFDPTGNVTKGPASLPLEQLSTEVQGHFLIIQLS